MYAIRPRIEEGNAQGNGQYNGKRMNIRGKEATIKYITLIYILMLLKALTAYKLNRKDLMRFPTAFSLLDAGKWKGFDSLVEQISGESLMLEGMIKGPDIVPDDFMGI